MGKFSTVFACLILASVIAVALSNPPIHTKHKKAVTTTTTTPEPTTTTTTHRSIFRQILRGLTGPHPEDRIKKEEAEKKKILEEKSIVPHKTKDNFEIKGNIGASKNDY